MRRRIVYAVLILAIVVVVAIVGSLLVPQRPSIPVKPFPNPNGYDTLALAARSLSPSTSDYQRLDMESLAALVDSNSNALQIARVGLQQEIRVPIRYTVLNPVTNLGQFRALGQAFVAEARLAELENKPQEAARTYVDTIRFGIESGRGGLLINELVALVIESLGTAGLERISLQLDAEACHSTADSLTTLDQARDPWRNVIEQENEYLRRVPMTIQQRISRLLSRSLTKKTEQQAEAKFNEHVLQTRRLILDLAARAYELDKGHRPTNASDLVPDYLKAIPQDPTTGTNLTIN